MDNNNFLSGLSKSLIEATKQVLEGKSHTLPKTDDEKDLAALAAPHGKITKKDVLVGRGVVKEEEQIDELSNRTMGNYVQKASRDVDMKSWEAGRKGATTPGSKDGAEARRVANNRRNGIASVGRRMSGEIAWTGKKIAKEEVEQVDELSKSTLASYAKKAIYSQKENDRHAKALTDLAHDEASRGEPEGARDFAKKAVKQITRSANRRAGVVRAIDKLAKEELELNDVVAVYNEDYGIGELLAVNESTIEVMFDEGVIVVENELLVVEDVEDLSELSKDTLRSYANKAAADPAFEKKKGKPSKATVAVRAKRTAGIEQAKAKLHAIVKKENDAHFAKMQKHADDLHAQFHKEAPGILKKHGFTKAAESDDRSTYIKPHENGHVTTMIINKKKGDFGYGSEYKGGSSGFSKSSGYTHQGIYDDKHAEEAKKTMMPKFEHYVIDTHESTGKNY